MSLIYRILYLDCACFPSCSDRSIVILDRQGRNYPVSINSAPRVVLLYVLGSLLGSTLGLYLRGATSVDCDELDLRYNMAFREPTVSSTIFTLISFLASSTSISAFISGYRIPLHAELLHETLSPSFYDDGYYYTAIPEQALLDDHNLGFDDTSFDVFSGKENYNAYYHERLKALKIDDILDDAEASKPTKGVYYYYYGHDYAYPDYYGEADAFHYDLEDNIKGYVYPHGDDDEYIPAFSMTGIAQN
jgi:hypothetical protein